ncbi:hypothetical protein GY45DRAFT_1320745 [Cubamyces sp. BRFM 1775]|nr:hypothetical protein GY45DRAFT_1320745 [Cubamyces sp. BRFM 1775]
MSQASEFTSHRGSPNESPDSGPVAYRTGRLHLLSLNQDALSYIISYLNYRDALSLSYTCKAAHALSLDPALHTVVLDRSSEQFLKFRDFLLATGSRPLFLRSLIITKTVTWDADDRAKDMADALADILDNTINLELFSCGAIRDLNKADMGIQTDLMALPRLADLTLLEGGPELSLIVSGMQSRRLRQLTLDMVYHSTKLASGNFFGKLAQYHLLHSLTISRMFDRIVMTPEAAVVIPSVRALALHTTYIPMSLAATIFPNVKHLTFTNTRHYPHFTHPTLLPHEIDTCWPTLDEAHIDARDLITWPLSSRVRWLDLDALRGGYSGEAIAAMNRMKPRVLSCAYTIDADNLFWTRLPIIASDLCFLDVRLLELSGHPRRYMLSHLSSFPMLTVVFLCIRVFYQLADPSEEIEEIANRIARWNRRLQFVGISFTDGRWTREDEPVWDEERLGSVWFKVHRDDTGFQATVEEVPTAVGLKVRDYMYEVDYDDPDWMEQLSARFS